MAAVAANAVRNFDLSRAIEVLEELRGMGTSRMAVHSLLDAAKPTMTIDSISRAASALGAKLEMRVVPRRAPGRRPVKAGRRAL